MLFKLLQLRCCYETSHANCSFFNYLNGGPSVNNYSTSAAFENSKSTLI